MNDKAIDKILEIVGEEALKTPRPPFSKNTPEHNAEYCREVIYKILISKLELTEPDVIAETVKIKSVEAIHTVTGSSPCSWEMGEKVYKRVLEFLKS